MSIERLLAENNAYATVLVMRNKEIAFKDVEIDRYIRERDDALAAVSRLRRLLSECRLRLYRPPQRGTLTHNVPERDYADLLARIDETVKP